MKYTLFILFNFLIFFVAAQHPILSLTASGVKKIKADLNKYPLFYQQYLSAKKQVDEAIKNGVDVPIPKDMAGGYSHEQHKLNYKLLQKAGNIYQISGDKKYAKLVKNVLYDYADLYQKTGLHPTEKSYARGKFFWQCLNDANWLVFVSQAYDCVYNYLSKKERNHLENKLFIPYANFLSEENPRFFNRIHNHSTWANAAVGMLAIAMENEELLQKALYGLNNTNSNAGFLAQLDFSFSPDGYFSEGPYYQRYAIFPFLVFSYALHNAKPQLAIFNYRNAILKKATNCLLQLTNPKGEFFPINDAQKGMNFKAFEVVNAIDLMYFIDESQNNLLQWAKQQNAVVLNEAGFKVAKNIENIKLEKQNKKSVFFNDGIEGNEGGISILRANNTDLLFKFTSQGMGHGHFDRLSIAFYDEAGEILQDYGAVRWVNVDQKGGGRYLPENKTFGKHSIAHNTLVVDETSHFNAKVKLAEKNSPELFAYNFENENLQMISAFEKNAYENVEMQRTLFFINDEEFTNPIVVDLMFANSNTNHTYDLPIWYNGHLMKSSIELNFEKNNLQTIGENNAYEHIYKKAKTTIKKDQMHTFNWFGNNQFYTKYTLVNNNDELILGMAGANDPQNNLRNDPVFVHRKKGKHNSVFVNILEKHGKYDTATEIPIMPYGSIENLKINYEDENYFNVEFNNNSYVWNISLSKKNKDLNKKHKIKINNKNYKWEGIYNLTKKKK